MPEHYMNPFWFVPTDGEVGARFSVVGWGLAAADGPGEGTATDGDTELLTGRIHLRLKTLTPLHVTGAIDPPANGAMQHRHFYRRKDPAGAVRPVVEGSSIRGMLRAYVEALTNGFVSVYKDAYEKVDGSQDHNRGRHVGFRVGPEPKEGTRKAEWDRQRDGRFVFGDQERVHAVNRPDHLWAPASVARADGPGRFRDEVRLDAASVMFGLTGSGEDTGEADRMAIAGRVRIDDAWFSDDALQQHDSLDLASNASMGGPKPNKSSWWYFKPGLVRERSVRARGGLKRVAEFVGADQYRGRKFYFHQDPGRCVRWYRDNWRGLKTVATECVGGGRASEVFTIHFDGLPRSLVRLLVVALTPSQGVRHKLGGLRPFGFGSVEFDIDRIDLLMPGLDGLDLHAGGPWREASAAERSALLADGTDEQTRELALAHVGTCLVDPNAWKWMRLIATWNSNFVGTEASLFVYPPFKEPGGFARPVQSQAVRNVRVDRKRVHLPESRPQVLKQIPGAIASTNPTKDLDHYQETARNFDAVKKNARI
ncbi:MAG: hypothetical protein D6798_05855 [Deltaproteobacteria bacterium]|nr:MAG: hypothetical protein D6798_05855 [Deltaproteobacteria bacterium]